MPTVNKLKKTMVLCEPKQTQDTQGSKLKTQSFQELTQMEKKRLTVLRLSFKNWISFEKPFKSWVSLTQQFSLRKRIKNLTLFVTNLPSR